MSRLSWESCRAASPSTLKWAQERHDSKVTQVSLLQVGTPAPVTQGSSWCLEEPVPRPNGPSHIPGGHVHLCTGFPGQRTDTDRTFFFLINPEVHLLNRTWTWVSAEAGERCPVPPPSRLCASSSGRLTALSAQQTPCRQEAPCDGGEASTQRFPLNKWDFSGGQENHEYFFVSILK